MALTRKQHAARQKGIGSSDAPAALGLPSFKGRTQYALWHEKRNPTDDHEDKASDERQRFGELLEGAIAQRVSEVERCPLQRVNQTLVSKEYPFMLAHLDRVIPTRSNTVARWNANAGKLNNAAAIVEIKNSMSDWGYGEEGTDDVPTHYLVQCAHQMIVSRVELCILAVLFRGSDLRRYPIRLTPDLAQMVIDGERKFWHMVKNNIEPPKTALSDVKLAYPISRAVEKEAPSDIIELLKEYRTFDARITFEAKERDDIEARIKDFLGDADTLTVMGVPVLTWKTGKGRTTIDAERLRKDKPDIAAEYTKTGAPVRTFRPKNAKDE
jgi:putative phage-type endonuclease